LTSGSSAGNAIVGQGQFIGCITLDTAGELKVQAVGVPPASGNYASWATENSVTGGTDGDSDFDGIKNLVEYGLSLNPAGSDGSPGTFASNTLTFTKRPVAITNADVSWVIETSTSLAPDSWTPVVTQAAGDAASTISYTPYDQAYPPGYEDMQRRVPDISKIKKNIGWTPNHSLDAIIDSVATSLKH
jgi:hypothetical protein